jgi:cation transport regulator ChaC
MEKSTIKLCGNITISDLKEFIHNQEKEKIADFILQRLEERYIIPLNKIPRAFKNGFNIMANCCLLIETYESYRTGLNSTSGKKCFLSFFKREDKFKDFIQFSEEFYAQVRCGILHQGETKGIWRINREKEKPLISEYSINANKFLKNLHSSLKEYKTELISSNWNDIIWENCINKLNQIILDCSVYYFAYGSNMNKTRLDFRIGADNSNLIGRGTLKDYELKFNKILGDGSAAANVEYSKGKITEGILYEIHPLNHSALEKLDKNEGVDSGHYYRRIIDIQVNNTTVQAFIYIADKNKTRYGIFPKKEYLGHLLHSKLFVSESYFQKLLNQQTQ